MTSNRHPSPVATQACAALNKQGERYRADVKADTVYCFQHHPERAEQAAAARKQVGTACGG